MTGTEMVTTFSLDERPGVPIKIATLITALNAHLKAAGLESEEYDFSAGTWRRYDDDHNARIPKNYRWLIAFAVEGGSEGYYVHVGAILQEANRIDPFVESDVPYFEFGLAKMYSAENAYAIAKEAQRFLTAAVWN